MDQILASWLQKQQEDWEAFAEHTDLVSVTPLQSETPCRSFVADFRCCGLVIGPTGTAVEAEHFCVGIHFGEDHLRRIDPLQLVWLLSPPNAFHPNIRFPAVCVGHLRPGIGLIEIILQVHSILTYQNVNMNDYLNRDAAAWARENKSRFPIDRRPLKRRDFSLSVEEVAIP